MNKKDIAHIRRQFKLHNENLNIKEIFNVYVQKETGDVYHHISQPFQLLDMETQELFLTNSKKVLTGQLDSKLFELKFKRDVEDNSQTILLDGLRAEETDSWETSMLQIVEKMFDNNVYDFDTVVTFIRGEYRKPVKQLGEDSFESENDNVYANTFILCSLNRTDFPETALVFDYIEKEFKAHNEVDPIINLTRPLTGFLFPTFGDYGADVNHILYNTGKPNQLDVQFIEDVLTCEDIITASEDKDCFELIVSNIAGEKVDSNVISNIYKEIDRIVEDSEEDEEDSPVLDYRDVEQILKTSGVENIDTEKVKDAFQTVVADEQHEFKANNLLPKTVKVNTETAKLSLKQENLKNMRYMTLNGKRCLVIEIDDDVSIEGFQLQTLKL